MTIKNADMPAMPITDESGMPFNGLPVEISTIGLTKREMMAMAAMQGLLSKRGDDDYDRHNIAKYSVEHADALLAELERAK